MGRINAVLEHSSRKIKLSLKLLRGVPIIQRILGHTFWLFVIIVLVIAVPLGKMLSLPLEQRFSRPGAINSLALEGIIVLAGDYARFEAGVAVAARHKHLKLILVTGPKTERVRTLARKHGISDARMTFELQSTTTYENAIFTRHLVAGANGSVKGRWLLVTSSTHMPRSIGVFRRAGFNVLAYPVFVTEYPHHRHNPRLALWEWGGLIYYYVRGRTGELWPAPHNTDNQVRFTVNEKL